MGCSSISAFFEQVVWQCVTAGLVDGRNIFVDSTLIDADASNNSVVDSHSLKRHLKQGYRELERRLEEEGSDVERSTGGVNERYRSTTDPDASVVNRGGKPKLQYQTHRAVDPAYEIITATEVTPGDVNEAHRMISLLDSHQENTGRQAEAVVADSKYGTIENYVACYNRGVKAHIPDLKKHQENKGTRKGIFSEDRFKYDPGTDTYRCPAGKILKRKSLHKARQSIEYSAPRKTCLKCELRPSCTRNKSGRTIKRHLYQDTIDQMRAHSRSAASKQDIRIRKHLMERSFARGTRYGFDRARWHGLWRVCIQECLTAAIQNIQVLIQCGKDPRKTEAAQISPATRDGGRTLAWVQLISSRRWTGQISFIELEYANH